MEGSSVPFRSVIKNVNRAVSPGARLTLLNPRHFTERGVGASARRNVGRIQYARPRGLGQQIDVLGTISGLRQARIAPDSEADPVRLNGKWTDYFYLRYLQVKRHTGNRITGLFVISMAIGCPETGIRESRILWGSYLGSRPSGPRKVSPPEKVRNSGLVVSET